MSSFNFAEKISLLRKSLGLNQSEFGKRLGVTNRAVSKWENDISMPSVESIYKICKLFNICLDYFFDNNDELVNPVKGSSVSTIRGLYKIGKGPSSSHTMGPEKACLIFKEKHFDADSYKVVLFGSLAQTGKGHRTDYAIEQARMLICICSKRAKCLRRKDCYCSYMWSKWCGTGCFVLCTGKT